MNFVAIDFETANSQRNSACSVAVTEVREGKLYDSLYALICPPELRFNPINIQIHGIMPQDVRNQPNFARLWPKLRVLLEHKLVVAHNASFDMSVLRNSLTTYGLAVPDFRYCCTVRLAKKAWPFLENHKLSTLGQHFNIDFQHHNALDDARTCAAIAILAARECGADSFEALAAQLNVPIQRSV